MSRSFDASTEFGVDLEPRPRVESRPISRSRTQPPTTSALPPASCTAAAIAFARASESGMNRLAAELLHDAIADTWRQGVEPHKRARLEVRVHLRDWTSDGTGNRLRNLLRTLSRADRGLNSHAGLARHHVKEFGLGGHGINDAHVNVGSDQLRREPRGERDLREFRRRGRAQLRQTALADDR